MESIEIQIAGRTYPLTVPADEVAAVRGAAAQLNDNMRRFQEQYGVDDPVDLLAMSALQWTTKALYIEAQASVPEADVLSDDDARRVEDLLQRLKAAVES
jgi:cell division protein ZapA (FtsZ GTPase activity inhibitor)